MFSEQQGSGGCVKTATTCNGQCSFSDPFNFMWQSSFTLLFKIHSKKKHYQAKSLIQLKQI